MTREFVEVLAELDAMTQRGDVVVLATDRLLQIAGVGAMQNVLQFLAEFVGFGFVSLAFGARLFEQEQLLFDLFGRT